MTDTIRELINRVLDYVERTPGARFVVARKIMYIESRGDCPYYFTFSKSNGFTTSMVSRYGTENWSYAPDLTEDNLRYLLEQLEKFEKLEGEER